MISACMPSVHGGRILPMVVQYVRWRANAEAKVFYYGGEYGRFWAVVNCMIQPSGCQQRLVIKRRNKRENKKRKTKPK